MSCAQIIRPTIPPAVGTNDRFHNAPVLPKAGPAGVPDTRQFGTFARYGFAARSNFQHITGSGHQKCRPSASVLESKHPFDPSCAQTAIRRRCLGE